MTNTAFNGQKPITMEEAEEIALDLHSMLMGECQVRTKYPYLTMGSEQYKKLVEIHIEKERQKKIEARQKEQEKLATPVRRRSAYDFER